MRRTVTRWYRLRSERAGVCGGWRPAGSWLVLLPTPFAPGESGQRLEPGHQLDDRGAPLGRGLEARRHHVGQSGVGIPQVVDPRGRLLELEPGTRVALEARAGA